MVLSVCPPDAARACSPARLPCNANSARAHGTSILQFVGINYTLPSQHAPGWMSSSGKGKMVNGTYIQPPVTAVTNLAPWYAYDQARYRTPGLSNSAKQSISNGFFLPHMSAIPSGRLTFKYARTPIFWDAVWTFVFVEVRIRWLHASHGAAR